MNREALAGGIKFADYKKDPTARRSFSGTLRLAPLLYPHARFQIGTKVTPHKTRELGDEKGGKVERRRKGNQSSL